MNKPITVSITELWLETKSEKKFLKAIKELCFDHTESDEEYSLSYEVEDQNTLFFKDFEVKTYEPEEFIDGLAALCEEFAEDGEFGFEA
jgi:hypothetical protein